MFNALPAAPLSSKLELFMLTEGEGVLTVKGVDGSSAEG